MSWPESYLYSIISFLVYLRAILNYCLLIYISDSSVDNREKLKDMQVHAGHFFKSSFVSSF